MRNKAGSSNLAAAAGAGGPPVTSSSSAATLPSYFRQQQTPPSTTALPPKLANGRVGYKAASSEDYGTGEKEGGVAVAVGLSLRIAHVSIYFERLVLVNFLSPTNPYELQFNSIANYFLEKGTRNSTEIAQKERGNRTGKEPNGDGEWLSDYFRHNEICNGNGSNQGATLFLDCKMSILI